MRKNIYYFLIMVVAPFNRAFGATSLCNCPNIYEQYCCSVSPLCCAANAAACESKCGIVGGEVGGEVGGCPSDCPSTTSWTSVSGNKEAKCDSFMKVCTYRCKKGYYNNGTSSITCTACPSYATCPAGSDMVDNLPICNKNYYGEKSLMVRPMKYVCTRCPQIIGPTGRPGYGITKSSGAKSITECYISSGTYKDETGTFEIENDCYYSE